MTYVLLLLAISVMAFGLALALGKIKLVREPEELKRARQRVSELTAQRDAMRGDDPAQAERREVIEREIGDLHQQITELEAAFELKQRERERAVAIGAGTMALGLAMLAPILPKIEPPAWFKNFTSRKKRTENV